MNIPALILTSALTCSLAGAAGTGEILNVKPTPALGKYCHVVRFSQGWKIQPFDDVGQRLTVDLTRSDYEFRVEGLLSTWFLVGVFRPEIEHRYDATNHYRVNLSDPTAPVLPVSAEDWKAATVVPLAQKSTFAAVGTLADDQPAVFNGFRFRKSGAWWPEQQYRVAARLSPDFAWLVLQSVTDAGISKLTRRSSYMVFLDVFNAGTGEKLLTIEAVYSDYGDSPAGGLRMTGWLTERYFIVPLGEHKERCLVCEFGGAILGNEQGRKGVPPLVRRTGPLWAIASLGPD